MFHYLFVSPEGQGPKMVAGGGGGCDDTDRGRDEGRDDEDRHDAEHDEGQLPAEHEALHEGEHEAGGQLDETGELVAQTVNDLVHVAVNA